MAKVLVRFPGASSADVQAMVARPAGAAPGLVSGLVGPYRSPILINAGLAMALSLMIACTVTPPSWRCG